MIKIFQIFKLKIIMKFLKSIFIIFIIDLFFLNSSFAQFKIIRDAEIEKTIFELAMPIIDVSEINKQAINFYIVNDSAINAFVAGGQNIFINSGLITKFNNPETLIGVLAHEIGHISAGHLARSGEEFEKSKNIAILSYLLGIGAMISGSADAGMAIISGGSDVLFKNQMKYTRWQEESADKLAMDYLSKAKIDSNGLIELLKYFYQENLGVKSVMNEYLLSHPVSEKRISAIRNYQQNHQIKTKLLSKELLQDFLMARAKHPGQKNNLDALCKRYKVDNTHRELHGALLDAHLLARVYLAMTGGQTRLLLDINVANSVEENHLAVARVRHLKDSVDPLVVVAPTEDERVAHRLRVEKIIRKSGKEPSISLYTQSQWIG